MPYTVTRLQMENRALRKADAVEDDHTNYDATILHDELNDLVAEAHRIVLSVDADRHTTSTTVSTTAGTFVYALPADFMSLRRLNDPDGNMIEPAPLLEMAFGDAATSGGPVYYRLVGGGQTGSTERLHLRPDPGTGSWELWYIIAPPVLSTDGATYDCRFGEHRYVIAGLAAFIAEREEGDSAPFRAEQARAEQHIREMAKRRDASRARQITDVRSQRSSWFVRYPRP